MSKVHPREENDVKGVSVEAKHIDYLYEIAAIADEYGTEEDKKEIRREMKKYGLVLQVSGVEMIRKIVAQSRTESDNDEYDPDAIKEFVTQEYAY